MSESDLDFWFPGHTPDVLAPCIGGPRDGQRMRASPFARTLYAVDTLGPTPAFDMADRPHPSPDAGKLIRTLYRLELLGAADKRIPVYIADGITNEDALLRLVAAYGRRAP